MKSIWQAVWSGLASSLGFLLALGVLFGLLKIVRGAVAESPFFFWAVMLAFIGFIIYGTFAGLRHPRGKGDWLTCFALAAAATFWFGMFWNEQRLDAIGETAAPILAAAVTGIPLGIGAVRLLKGPSLPLTAGDAVVAVATGMPSAVLALLLALPILGQAGLFVPWPQITVVDFLGLNLVPESDTLKDLTCTATGKGPADDPDWCTMGRFRSLQYLLAMMVQGVQSAVVSMWDTIWLFAGVIVTSAYVRLVLRKAGVLRN